MDFEISRNFAKPWADRGIRNMFRFILTLIFGFCVLLNTSVAQAQTISVSTVQIEWKVVNRFRFFKDAETFRAHEIAWRQYLQHVDGQNLDEDSEQRLILNTSTLGTEHVLNDRYIPFSQHLRTRYDWRGWAAKTIDQTCWNAKARAHAACGSVEDYVVPKSHEIEAWLKPLQRNTLLAEFNCEWRVGEAAPVTAPCDEPVRLLVNYPQTSTVSVNVENERPIVTELAVKDLLIVGMGDSFASGEGNPDVPVTMAADGRFKTYYPRRAKNDVTGNAQWLDERCHRSLYGHQLRAALQVAIENPKASVTYMGYACSGAAIEEGLLGPQTYVDYEATTNNDGTLSPKSVTGGKRQNQFYWLLRELCRNEPDRVGGIWTCPNNDYRRNVDFLLLSVGGNDIGFSNLVAWATLRASTSSAIAKFFGATVAPQQFEKNMRNILPPAFGLLAKAIETSIPINSGEQGFDASRVVLTAYPDILADETGKVCAAGSEDESESAFAANQSLNVFSSWLVVSDKKINSAHDKLADLHKRMGELAEDHGWHFAGRAYADRPFRGHGFCARNPKRLADPAEHLVIPCWGKAKSDTENCETNFSGKQRNWRPFNPASENFPYALRQRWVRSFNDAYMIINGKITGPNGRVDDRASEVVFTETTGAMHPTAEGHAAMADAILIDLRDDIAKVLGAVE
jgi:hypothetical protein